MATYDRPERVAEHIGGGRDNSASILETIALIKEISGKELKWEYSDTARKGDHICYITNMHKFKTDYPEWKIKMSLKDIVKEIVENENLSMYLSLC